MFRMRTAGYHGPDIFTPEAVNLIAKASGGLTRRANIFADKALLAAFIGNTHGIEAHHVKAAIEDSEPRRHQKLISGLTELGWLTELSCRLNWLSRPGSWMIGSIVLLVGVLLGVLGSQVLRPSSTGVPPANAPTSQAVAPALPAPVPAADTPRPAMIAADGVPPVQTPPSSPPTPAVAPAATVTAAPTKSVPVMSAPAPAAVEKRSPADTAVVKPSGAGGGAKARSPQAGDFVANESARPTITANEVDIATLKLTGYKLLQERVEAAQEMMATADNKHFSIQLFITNDVQPARMQRFLIRANSLVKLSDLYVYPEKSGGQTRFRVMHGIYPTRDQAVAALTKLPQKYKTAFHPEIRSLADLN